MVQAGHLLFGYVDRQFDPRDLAVDQGALHGDLSQSRHLVRRIDYDLIAADILEHFLRIDFLVVLGPAFPMGDLTCDRHDPCTLAPGIVQPIDQVKRSGTDGSGTNPDPAGQMRLGIGCVFLVPDSNPFEPVIPAHGFEQGVERIARHAEDLAPSGIRENIQQYLAYGIRRHDLPSGSDPIGPVPIDRGQVAL